MKIIFFTVTLALLSVTVAAQRLSRITLSNSGTLDIISFLTDDEIFINVTKDGKIIDWGVEPAIVQYNNYPGKLAQYMGGVEYFSTADNEDVKGKVKYIGRNSVTYFSSGENELLKGKVKSMGSIYFDYYDVYSDSSSKGKIKNAGLYAFSYYTAFDNEAYKGRIKNVGSSLLTYYASYEDKAYRGKIKSIDNVNFNYYSSFDRREYQGALKSGGQMQYIINGIKYYLRN